MYTIPGVLCQVHLLLCVPMLSMVDHSPGRYVHSHTNKEFTCYPSPLINPDNVVYDLQKKKPQTCLYNSLSIKCQCWMIFSMDFDTRNTVACPSFLQEMQSIFTACGKYCKAPGLNTGFICAVPIDIELILNMGSYSLRFKVALINSYSFTVWCNIVTTDVT